MYLNVMTTSSLESLFEQNKKQNTLRGELEKTLEAMTEAKQRLSMFL